MDSHPHKLEASTSQESSPSAHQMYISASQVTFFYSEGIFGDIRIREIRIAIYEHSYIRITNGIFTDATVYSPQSRAGGRLLFFRCPCPLFRFSFILPQARTPAQEGAKAP